STSVHSLPSADKLQVLTSLISVPPKSALVVMTSFAPSQTVVLLVAWPIISLVVSLPEVSYFTVRFWSPCAPLIASSIVTAGSAWVILRVSELGGGMGPKLLLSLSIFQSPEKFGLSAATANEARAATSKTKVVIFFIARESP